MRPRRLWLLLLAFLLYLCTANSVYADIKIDPPPTRWTTDTTGFLSPQTVAELDSQLQAFEQETGHQVLVYIGKTTGGYPIEEWAVKAFEAWKVGRKGLDDGLVLFILVADRKIRIEVGYGLEGVVTDAKASQVINDILVPGIRSGDNDGAVKAAVASLLATISGKPFAPSPRPREVPPGTFPVPTIFLIIAAIFFLILFISNPYLALWLLFNILSGGGGGGRGGGRGDGWRGGGGRSGGGGASGGW